MGFTDPAFLIVEPTLAGGPEEAEKRKADAIAEARDMAKTF